MIRGEDTVPLMGTAAACTIALINPDVIYLTGTATLNIRESDIIDYCKQTIPETTCRFSASRRTSTRNT